MKSPDEKLRDRVELVLNLLFISLFFNVLLARSVVRLVLYG